MIANPDERLYARVHPTDEAESADNAPGGRKPLPLLHILWRQRGVVLLVTFAGAMCAGIYLLKATPIYTSSSRIFVDQQGPKLLTTDSSAGLVKSDSYLYTQAQVLASTPILSAALQDILIPTMKTFAQADNPLLFLKREMKVDVGKKDDLITVSMDSSSPAEAAQIVNSVVDAYVTYSSKIKRTSAGEVIKILEKERDKSGEELATKLKAMMEFKRENGALSFQSEKGNIVLERLAALQESLTAMELQCADARADFETGAGMLKDPVQIRRYVDAQQSKGRDSLDPEYGELRAELRRYVVARSQINLSSGSGSRSVASVTASIDELNKSVAERERRFAEGHLAELQQRLEAAKSKESSIRAAFEAQKKEALDLNSKATQYALLEADLNRIQKTCDLLDSRIKETNVTEDGGALNIQVLEVARPGEKPTQPRKALTMAVALLVGLMLGTGLGLTREWMDRKLRGPDEIIAALGLPVLGVIPRMKGRQSSVLRGQNVARQSMSEVAEAYRSIRTAVQFGTRTAEAVKTMLVTSPAAGDGKSTCASNLAIAFAQAGYRTLLIDCDLRRPAQHKIFELDTSHGLTSVIAGQVKLAASICKTDTNKLSILPCGPTPTNPSELLSGRRFTRIMAALVGAFDKIIIDSPPALAVTDARILAASADITLLVFRADKSTDRQSAVAVKGLQSVGAVILGALMNDMPRRKDADGYYSGYYYYGNRDKASRLAPVPTDITGETDNPDDIEYQVEEFTAKAG